MAIEFRELTQEAGEEIFGKAGYAAKTPLDVMKDIALDLEREHRGEEPAKTTGSKAKGKSKLRRCYLKRIGTTTNVKIRYGGQVLIFAGDTPSNTEYDAWVRDLAAELRVGKPPKLFEKVEIALKQKSDAMKKVKAKKK
jgi:hypothetical protein